MYSICFVLNQASHSIHIWIKFVRISLSCTCTACRIAQCGTRKVTLESNNGFFLRISRLFFLFPFCHLLYVYFSVSSSLYFSDCEWWFFLSFFICMCVCSGHNSRKWKMTECGEVSMAKWIRTMLRFVCVCVCLCFFWLLLRFLVYILRNILITCPIHHVWADKNWHFFLFIIQNIYTK